jgi:hypothetical protein
MRWMRQELEISTAKHLRQIQSCLHINRQGIRLDTCLLRLAHCLTDISNAVAIFIAVVVGRFAITDEQ